MVDDHETPAWAPRVRQAKIRKLYENDAQGIYDDELIDDVGYSLLVRCQSFIEAVEAAQGKATCPRCRSSVVHTGNKEELLHCDACGWELSWGEYFKTFRHKQLSGAEPVIRLFQEFVSAFPAARTAREKVLWIDRLIHGFHWFAKTDTPTRPVAINLIQGRLRQVIEFLDSLTYGEKSTPGTAEKKAEWNQNIQTARSWYRGKEKRGET
jgi:ribosomal protein L37AE/L43A